MVIRFCSLSEKGYKKWAFDKSSALALSKRLINYGRALRSRKSNRKTSKTNYCTFFPKIKSLMGERQKQKKGIVRISL